MASFCFLGNDKSNVFSLSTSNKGFLPGKASVAAAQDITCQEEAGNSMAIAFGKRDDYRTGS